MSLINKMLQDLDQRGSPDAAGLPPDIRAAAVSERRVPRKQVIIGASALTVCAAVAAFIWLKRPVPAVGPGPIVAQAAPPVLAPIVTPAPVVAPAAPKVASVAPAAAVNKTAMAVAAPVPVPESAAREASAPLAAADGAVQEAKAPSARAAAPERAAQAPSAPALPRVVAVATPPATAPGAGGRREQTVAQRSESSYRQALAALDEGRVTAAYSAFDEALRLNPRHDAARRSLVSLLLEDGRTDEAMAQLEQGLAADASQSALAMLLARLQIERGQSGVATLLRTLPSAAGNADYHAFLAGALQRDGRHKEALEQYGAALRIMPGQGVWLMGLGISLQAEKRNRDAADAFGRAKASGMLTPALDSFVERKLQQLAQ